MLIATCDILASCREATSSSSMPNGGTGVSPVQPGGDARLSTNKESIVVRITNYAESNKLRHCHRGGKRDLACRL
jgi:hypothetical protein